MRLLRNGVYAFPLSRACILTETGPRSLPQHNLSKCNEEKEGLCASFIGAMIPTRQYDL